MTFFQKIVYIQSINTKIGNEKYTFNNNLSY